MSRVFFKAWHSYLESIEPLNDAERGRLFTALLKYSAQGTVEKLSGNERFVFPTMKANIDREMEKYAENAEKNKENGKRGGRPKKSEKPSGFSKTQSVFKNPNGFSKTQDKEKDKEKDKDYRPRACAREDDVVDGVESLVLDDFAPLIESSTDVSLTEKDRGELVDAVQRYGQQIVEDGIMIAIDRGAHTWEYIRKTIETQAERPDRKPDGW